MARHTHIPAAASEYFPGPHEVQSDEEDESECFPGSQARQADEDAGENVPASHDEQVVAHLVPAYVPPLHWRQDEAPEDDA
jgi:hypothetical protein